MQHQVILQHILTIESINNQILQQQINQDMEVVLGGGFNKASGFHQKFQATNLNLTMKNK